MRNRRKQFGVTLTELVVVVAVVALLVGLAIPAVKTFNSMVSSSAGIESMISAALSSGRALAAKHQRYAGIRFQQDKDGNQYMIPIVYDSSIGEGVQGSIGLRAVKGLNPIRLPEDLIVLDLKLNNDVDIVSNPNDSQIDESSHFSILFSAAGSLVVHKHRVASVNSNDTVFNSSGDYLFEEDGSTQTEDSRNCLMVCYRKELYDATDRWDDYLADPDDNMKPDPDKMFYINPYTGGIISQK